MIEVEKFSKEYHKRLYLLLGCLCTLFIGFQSCAKNDQDTSPSKPKVEVTGITNSSTPQNSWTWSCSNPACTFRHFINQQSESYEFPNNHNYDDENTAQKSDVEGNYYLHIQAKDSNNNESEVKTVSIVIGQEGQNDFFAKQLDTGGLHTCSLSKDLRMKCWGNNEYGQLGQGHTQNVGDGINEMSQLRDINVHPDEPDHLPEFIATGAKHTCAVLENKCVKCWGDNKYGQLGYSDTNNNRGDEADEMGSNLGPVGGLDFKVKTIVTGSTHTCAIMNNDKVRCWGQNDQGQLGQGSTNNAFIEPDKIPDVNVHPDEPDHLPESIVAGAKHTCVVLENKCVKCWGNNKYGQLGYSDTNNNRGDEANEMGSNLGPVGGLAFKVKTLAAGDWHTCAIMKDDSVKCWGRNDKGQLGQNSRNNIVDPTSLASVNLGGRTAKSIVTGAKHTCVTLDDESMKCWGFNEHGQLGQGSTDDIVLDEIAGNLKSVPVDSSRKIASTSANGDNTCFILDNGKIKCWGNNDYGKLGQGHICSLGNGKGYSASTEDDPNTNDFFEQCNAPNADDVIGKTVDTINPVFQ